MEKFDLAIIGAGPAGYESAIFASKNGLKTVLIEKDELGGTCLNNGCIPTKTLLHTADLYNEVISQSAKIGIDYSNISFNMEKMQQRKQEVLSQLRDGIQKSMNMHKVSVIKGFATIINEHQINIKNNEQTELIEATNILITTGSVPAVPPIDGAKYTLTSDDLLNDNKVYDNLIIIGGGVIGIEFASLYSSLGKKVIIIEALDRILANMDKEFAQSLKMLLSKRNVEIHTKSTVTKITSDNNKVTCHYTEKNIEKTVTADAVLMAVGRRAYSENLFTKDITVDMDRGKIKVNEHYQTSINNIYAAGDIIGGIQLAHMATAEAINAVCHILNKEPIYDTSLVPSCIYTTPEIASVGMTLEEAKQLGKKVSSIKYPMGANGKSLLSLQERSFIKVIIDSETSQILGAQLMCARATDMISQFSQAICNKLTLKQLQKIIYPHPTFSEGIGKALEK